MPSLLVENGPEKGRRLELKAGGRAALGRDKTCEVSVADHLCSRRHFEVLERGSAWIVRDLGSSNGTFVNDERVDGERALKDGDAVQAGETRLVFQGDAAPGEPSQTKGLVGRVVGGYRILDRLGRGAMGTVYKANQTSLNRVVALKILSPKVAADPAFVKRFQSEAQAAGRLNHPNVVQVYDVGQDQGLHYYSMEYIENGTVEDLLRKQGRLDAELAVDVLLDAAKGLVFAEKKGLVHRDIKPANLMINGEGVVKIADLGLAHDMGSGSRGDEPIFGTPHFISPEQAQGRPVDARSDLYSLGATAYFLLAGQTPFDGENVQEIVRKQIEEDAPPLRDKRPDASAAVCEIVAKLMRKDPADRYAGAQAVVDALEHAAAPPGGSKKTALIAAAAILFVGGAFAVWKFGPGADRPEEPTTTRPNTGADDSAKAQLQADRAETEKLRREADAKTALGEARLFDGEARTASSPDWPAVLTRYRAVVETYPGTDAAAVAARSVEEIGQKFAEETARKDAESRAVASRTALSEAAVSALRSEIEPLLAAHAYGDALVRSADAKRRLPDDAALQAEAQRLIDAAVGAGIAKAAETLAAARDMEGRGDGVGGARLLEETARLMAGSTASPATQKIDEALKPLLSASIEMRRRDDEKRRADRSADVLTVFEARRAAGDLLQKSADLEAAGVLLNDAEGRLRGIRSDSPFAGDKLLLASAVRVRNAWLQNIKSLPKDAKVKLPSPSDRKRTLEYVFVSADEKGVTVKRGAVEARFDLATFALADAYEYLFKESVEKSEPLRADVVRLLILAGRADRAAELAATLPDTPERSALAGSAAREASAWALLAEIRELTPKVQADESLAGQLLRKLNQLIEDFSDTRASLLNRRDPPAIR